MTMLVREYHRPTGLAETVSLLRRSEVTTLALAGGTELLSDQSGRAVELVDLGGLELDFVNLDQSAARLGAMATLQRLVDHEALVAFADGVIGQAAWQSNTRILRHAATLGGTLASSGDFGSDLAVVLRALQAKAVVMTPERLTLNLSELGPMLRQGALIISVEITRPPSEAGVGYSHLGRLRTDYSLVSAAVVIGLVASRCTYCRAVLGGIGVAVTELTSLDRTLVGSNLAEIAENDLDGLLQEHLREVDVVSDWRASGQYRRQVAKILLRRAIIQASARSRYGGLSHSADGDAS